MSISRGDIIDNLYFERLLVRYRIEIHVKSEYEGHFLIPLNSLRVLEGIQC